MGRPIQPCPVDDVQDLLDCARRGDEQAWEVLFRRSYPRLLSYAARRLPTAELAARVARQWCSPAWRSRSRRR
jgi:hypothetical protein